MAHTDLTSDWAKIINALTCPQSSAAQAEFDAWVRELPERQELVGRLRSIMQPLVPAHNPDKTEMELNRLMAGIQKNDIESSRKALRKARPMWFSASAVAAIILVICGIGFIGISRQTTGSSSVTRAHVSSTYVTRHGQRASIELEDGTHVDLNVGSSLQVPGDFGRSSRSVNLVGQAVFNVRSQAQSPLIVNAPGTQVVVLGTVFSVKAYDSAARVTVQSGKIGVGTCHTDAAPVQSSNGFCKNIQRRTVLTANESVTILPSGDITIKANVDFAMDQAFVSGYLLLPRRPLAEILGDLNRWYDADIRLNDPALGKLVLGGWLAAGPIEDLVQYLSGPLPIRVERVGRVLTLYSIPSTE